MPTEELLKALMDKADYLGLVEQMLSDGGIGVAVADKKTLKFKMLSPIWREWVGGRSKLYSLHVQEVVHPEDRAVTGDCLSGGSRFVPFYNRYLLDGRTLYLQWISTVEDKDNFYGMVRSISEADWMSKTGGVAGFA